MKITKRQLRRIIREEKSNILKEQIEGWGMDDPIDELVQEMFAAYNKISARVDDVEDTLAIELLGRVNELLNVLEKLSEDINATSR